MWEDVLDREVCSARGRSAERSKWRARSQPCCYLGAKQERQQEGKYIGPEEEMTLGKKAKVFTGEEERRAISVEAG